MTPEDLMRHIAELPEPLRSAGVAVAKKDGDSNLEALKAWHPDGPRPISFFWGYHRAVVETLAEKSGCTIEEINAAIRECRHPK
jgi:hypothetical protein